MTLTTLIALIEFGLPKLRIVAFANSFLSCRSSDDRNGSAQLRMLQMKPRSILIGFGYRQQFGFAIEVSQKGQAGRRSRSAAIYLAVIADSGGWCVIATRALGQNQR